MYIATILAILVGIFEIRYAFKVVEKENKLLRRIFIAMGGLTTILGLVVLMLI